MADIEPNNKNYTVNKKNAPHIALVLEISYIFALKTSNFVVSSSSLLKALTVLIFPKLSSATFVSFAFSS